MHSKMRALAAVLTVIAAILPGIAAAELPTCQGFEATYVGTEGPDIFEGTAARDVVVALGGADIIHGNGGDDVICAGTGGDTVYGGPGDDLIIGGRGNDELRGGNGEDVVRGAKGRDEVRGGNAPDVVVGGDGFDRAYGGGDDDVVKGGGGDDTLWGGTGNDVAAGQEDTDSCQAETESTCERDPHDFSFERFYINQGVPAADSDASPANRVDTVIKRAGIVRAFIGANWTQQDESPEVVLHWRAGGNAGVIDLSGPATVPTNPAESNLDATFNATFGTGFIRNGMEVYLEIDPDDVYEEHDESNNRWPTSGWFDIGATAVPRFDITFVPITLNGTSKTFTMVDAEALLEETLGAHPIGTSDIEIRAPYAFNGSTQQDWITLLNELANLRDNTDRSDRIYYGVLPGPISPGIGGIGFIGYPVSLGLEDDHIAAHELGHNLDLPHAPCGGPADADPAYPYSGASIGSWGYDVAGGVLKSPSTHTDLMSYCTPAWISDYNYANVLDFRTSAWGYAMVETSPHAGETTLSLVGSIDTSPAASETVRLTSVKATERAARHGGGDYTLVGRDSNGRVLFSTAFEAFEYADGPEGTERLFLVDATIDVEDVDRLVDIEIRQGGRFIGARRGITVG